MRSSLRYAPTLCVLIHYCVAIAVDVPGTLQPIKIDGHFIHLHRQDKHLGESAWQRAARITGLPHTNVYALHDANFLYLGFVCGDEDQGEAKGEVRTRDNVKMWKDSCVEVFLDVGGRTYQFILTHVGAVSDLMNSDARFDFDVRCHSLWDRWDWKHWYLEAAFPIAEIDPGREHSVWKFNLCRTIWRNGKMTSVSLVPRGKYRALSFSGEYGKVQGLSIASPPIEIGPGTRQARLSVHNPRHHKGVATIVAESESPSGILLREETPMRLQGKTTETAVFRYSFGKEEGLTRFTVRLVNSDGLILASTTHYYNLRTNSKETAFLDSSMYFSDSPEATLTLNVGRQKHGASVNGGKVIIEVKPFGGATPVIKVAREWKRLPSAISFPVNNLRPGRYQVTTMIVNRANHKVLWRFEDRFEKVGFSLSARSATQ